MVSMEIKMSNFEQAEKKISQKLNTLEHIQEDAEHQYDNCFDENGDVLPPSSKRQKPKEVLHLSEDEEDDY